MFFNFLFLLTFSGFDDRSRDLSIIDGFVSFDFDIRENISNKFEGISVSLYSSNRNNLIDKLEIPQSGYFIFPTPDTHSCVLYFEGPKGTCFDKNNIQLLLSRENNENYEFIPKENEDLNVKVMGYTLSGQVTYKSVNISSTFDIELYDNIANKTTIISTDQTGFFSYKPIIPSSYSIQVSNTVSEMINFNITNSSYFIKSLNILEKAVRFRMIFPGKYQNTFRKHPNKIRLCYYKEDVDTGSKLNYVFPDENGEFILHGLDPGNYSIVADSFSIHPTYFIVDESYTYENVELYYKGITITGEVFYPNNNEYIANATIIINNYETKTNSNGYFSIENVMPSDFVNFSVVYPYTEFFIPRITKISINKIKHLRIPAKNGPIAGYIDCHCPTNVIVEVGGAIRKTLRVNSNNEFGFGVPLGQEVIISVICSNPFYKFENNVIFAKSPQTGICFMLKKSIIQGDIECIHKCDNILLKLTNYFNNQFSYLAPISENGHFSIEKIPFGEYIYEIVSNQSHDHCLNRYFFFMNYGEGNIIIVNDEIVNMKTVAKQYYQELQIISPVDMTVFDLHAFIQIKKGLNNIITNATKIYPVDYHLFEPLLLSPSIINEISLTAYQWFVNVNISGNDHSESSFSILLNGSKLESPYSFIQDIKEIINVSISFDKSFLITSPSFYVLNNETIENLSTNEIIFSLVSAFDVYGYVSPPVSGVRINCYHLSQVIKSVKTDENGYFEVGTFPYTQHVTLVASKEGYIFKRMPKSFNFSSERLVNLHISLESEKETNFNNTIISLTRSDGYIQTVVVNESTVVFPFLSVGEYCITPAKASHSFFPSFQIITIENHNCISDQTIVFKMKKTKFMISGRVDYLNNNKKDSIMRKDITIYAKKANDEKSIYSAMVSSNGFFAFKNLPFNTTYKLYFDINTITNPQIHSISPSSKYVSIYEEDVNDIRFIIIPQQETFDILGNIELEQKELLPTVFVQLSAQSPNKVIDNFDFTSGIVDMFYFLHLKKGLIYKLEVKSKMESLDKTIDCEQITISSMSVNSSLHNAVIKCNVNDDHILNDEIKNDYLKSRKNFLLRKENLITILVVLIWIMLFNFIKLL